MKLLLYIEAVHKVLISPKSPINFINTKIIKDEGVADAFRLLLRILDQTQQDTAKVINTNAMVQISQATQPTPAEGEWYIWLNTSGTATEAKARIVTTQNGLTYSFKSAEVY